MDTKPDGEKKAAAVMLYTLSTCVWCRKTKELLKEMGIEYKHIDVDNLKGEEKKNLLEEVKKWNPACSFPTLVINNEKCVVGFKEDKIKEALGQ